MQQKKRELGERTEALKKWDGEKRERENGDRGKESTGGINELKLHTVTHFYFEYGFKIRLTLMF